MSVHYNSQSPKKQQQRQQKSPQSHHKLFNWNPKGEDEKPKSDKDETLESDGGAAVKGTLLAGLLLVGVVGGFGTVGYLYKDQINTFLTQFSTIIEGYGPGGYVLFVAVYAGLEWKPTCKPEAVYPGKTKGTE